VLGKKCKATVLSHDPKGKMEVSLVPVPVSASSDDAAGEALSAGEVLCGEGLARLSTAFKVRRVILFLFVIYHDP
jgi:hypothetical protein